MTPNNARRSPRPMKRCPEPPKPGESRQLGWWRVRATNYENPKACSPRFYVETMETGEHVCAGVDWRRLMHHLGVYPMDGLELGQRIPKTGEPTQPWWKKKPPPQLRPPEPPPPTDADAPGELRQVSLFPGFVEGGHTCR